MKVAWKKLVLKNQHTAARSSSLVSRKTVHREGEGVEEVDRNMEEDIPNKQIGPHTPFVEAESSLQSNQEI
jgi:hypothetical protein